ncbi:MAG: NAD(P)-binding domain-containing protein [Candidatus Promineifilaceae bacterium]|nr:NAD(P)-binding domain-containing protein [Candidatus Promineifilaceae bacterium]
MTSLSNYKQNTEAVSLAHLQNSKGPVRGRETGRLRCAAVIGGGPSGIQAAGQLMKRNFHVTVYERHGQLGGIWCYERNNHLSQPSQFQGIKPSLPLEVSPMYKDLRTNVPYQSMAIDGFAVPRQEEIRFVHRSEILNYLDAYLRHLEQAYPGQGEYRLNANIESVTYDRGWSVISCELGTFVKEKFDVVVVATGAFHKPFNANLHDSEFEGVSFHSLYYDDPAVLDNRTVLIIGGGNSAKDIFWDAMARAQHVVLACPSEQDRNNVVLPDDHDSKLLESFTSVGRVKRVRKDGTVIHMNWQGQEEVLDGLGIDMIIYCTGYKKEFPSLKSTIDDQYDGARNARASEINRSFGRSSSFHYRTAR